MSDDIMSEDWGGKAPKVTASNIAEVLTNKTIVRSSPLSPQSGDDDTEIFSLYPSIGLDIGVIRFVYSK